MAAQEPISTVFQKGKYPFYVLVSGKTCAPCKEAKRKLKEWGVKFHEADMEENVSFCMAHRVMCVPTLLMFTAADQSRRIDTATMTKEMFGG